MRSPNNIYDIFKCLLCHVQSNFILLMRKNILFFFPKLTQLLCVPFILTPVLKYSRQRLLLFSTINLLVRFQAKALLQLDLYLSTLFFPFCYRLVRTYVREHISVFNKNDRRNLFLSAHIILVWACF